MIDRGHKYDDIVNVYSLELFFRFFREAEEARDRELHDTAFIMRAAMQYQDKDFKKVLASLTKEGRKKMAKPITRSQASTLKLALSGRMAEAAKRMGKEEPDARPMDQAGAARLRAMFAGKKG